MMKERLPRVHEITNYPELGAVTIEIGKTMPLSSGLNKDGQDLYALYPVSDTSYKSLGKITLLTYEEKKLNLVIVPLEGVSYNFGDVQKELNRIYGPLGLEWEVRTDEAFTSMEWDLNENKILDAEESQNFSMYSAEMRALNRLYKEQREVDKKTMYLFVVKAINGKPGALLGDMPLSSQFGYLAASNDATLAAITIAHELGHGMFYLRHTFSQYNLDEGSTDNLMDYRSGTQLFKKQWDEIFDPRRPWFAWRQDEEEGALAMKEGVDINLSLENDVFAPGNTPLKIKYAFQFIPSTKEDPRIPINRYPLKVDVKLDEVLIHSIKDMTKGEFAWNGFMTEGDYFGKTITYEHGEFAVSFQNQVNNEDKVLSPKIYKEIYSRVDEDWEMFQNFIFRDMISYGDASNGFLRYKDIKHLYQRNELIGNSDPIDYLNKYLIKGNFFDREIIVHRKFYCILKDIEEEIKSSGKYNQFKTSFGTIENFMRMSTTNKQLSLHAFGFAFDIDKEKNPYITKESFYKIINMITGYYLRDSKVGLDDIWKAGEIWKQRVIDKPGIDANFIIGNLRKIENYLSSKEFPVYKLDEITEGKNKIIEDFGSIISEYISEAQSSGEESPEKRMELLEKSVKQLNDILVNYDNIMYLKAKNDKAFHDLSKLLESYRKIIEGSRQFMSNRDIDGLNASVKSIEEVQFGDAITATSEISRIKKEILTGNSLEGFINQFNKEINEVGPSEGKYLFTHGFINVENIYFKDFIRFMSNHSKINWGGGWNSKDFMHFELEKSERNNNICNDYKIKAE